MIDTLTHLPKTIQLRDERERCAQCFMLPVLCFCPAIRQVHCPLAVTIVMQWSEYWRVSNSGRLAKLTLNNSSLLLRGEPGGLLLSGFILPSHENAFLLFPGPGVPEVEAQLFNGYSDRIYVPDGTWREASKIARKTHFLNSMRRIQLPVGCKSRYGLRRAPKVGSVCTLESIAMVLEIAGYQVASDQLRQNLEKLVATLMSIRPEFRKAGAT